METQATVHQWVNDTFPNYGTKERRALAIIEEAVELALAAGLTPEQVNKAVQVPVLKAEQRQGMEDHAEDDIEEAADVLLSVYAYAGVVNFDVHAALDHKMAYNRSRPLSYYQMKTKQKEELGMPK